MAEIRVLSAHDVQRALTMGQAIEAVEAVYRARSEGAAEAWPTVFHVFEEGKADLDIKSGHLVSRGVYGHKTMAWFGDNEQRGLPTLNGIIAVFDDVTGMPCGIVDGSFITGMRTGAAGAVGAKYLAREDAERFLLVGAGNQGMFQLAAMLTVKPALKAVAVYDRNAQKAEAFAAAAPERLRHDFGIDAAGVAITCALDIEKAVRAADIIVTVTPSREPIVQSAWVAPGTHLSCIGADMEGKQEVASALCARARLFVDDREHCMQVGEIERPLKEGAITPDAIVCELGDVILGKQVGREHAAQITLFDATGMALLDIAAAQIALDAARECGAGTVAAL